MNRYGKGPTIGGPTKATSTTLCQKCLKRGHYSYECKEVVQSRPYVPRPSRTAQLFNPKLVPKLREDVPQELLRKKGVADEQLAKAALERGRKREREETDHPAPSKRMRSNSVSSVSTISTNMSRSPSPDRRSKDLEKPNHKLRTETSTKEAPSLDRARTNSTPRSERKRRRDSVSSNDSYASGTDRRGRANSRSIRRRYQRVSPSPRGRPSESRSPHRGRGGSVNDRSDTRDRVSNSGSPLQPFDRRMRQKERSLSPFSKRLALTQSMNMGR